MRSEFLFAEMSSEGAEAGDLISRIGAVAMSWTRPRAKRSLTHGREGRCQSTNRESMRKSPHEEGFGKWS